jgi:DNA-binding response OmpR family regulator
MVAKADHERALQCAAPIILVVEDEPLIRMDLADSLRSEGFRVIEASGPDEARAVMSSGVAVGCVLTDLHMPNRDDGLELLRWFGARHPDTAILVASGVPDSIALAGSQGANIFATFDKPYRPSAIFAALHALMRRGAAQS